MKQKFYLIFGIFLVVALVGLVLVTDYFKRSNIKSSPEAVLPVEIKVFPFLGEGISSGLLEINKTMNITIKLKTANVNARILDGNYSGKLILIGENVTPSYKLLWKGKIEKGIEKTYVVKVTPHSKACFLKVSFYTDYDNAPRDYIIIKNEPEATHWQLPENVSEKEGVIYKNFSKI